MNGFVRGALFFGAGVAVGLAGREIIRRGNVDVKGLAAGALSRGMDAADCIKSKLATVKEDVDDVVAEAKQVADERKKSTTKKA